MYFLCVDNSGSSGNGDGDWSLLTFLTLKLGAFLEYRDDLLDPKIFIAFYVLWSFKCDPLLAALLRSDRSFYLSCSLVPTLKWHCGYST